MKIIMFLMCFGAVGAQTCGLELVDIFDDNKAKFNSAFLVEKQNDTFYISFLFESKEKYSLLDKITFVGSEYNMNSFGNNLENSYGKIRFELTNEFAELIESRTISQIIVNDQIIKTSDLSMSLWMEIKCLKKFHNY